MFPYFDLNGVVSMVCRNCGSQIADTSVVCPRCGVATAARPAPVYTPPPQPVYSTQVYTQAPAQSYADEHVSVGMWIGIFFINFIPILGSLIYLVMLFVWAFGNTPKRSLKNFAKAQLVLMLIALILGIIAFIIMMALGYSLSDLGNDFGGNYYY